MAWGRALSRLKQAGFAALLAVPVVWVLLVGFVGGLVWGLREFLLLFATSDEIREASAPLGDAVLKTLLVTAVGASAYYAVLTGIWFVIRRVRGSA